MVYVTHVQIDELVATKKPTGRREDLLAVLKQIDPARIATSVAVWNVSKWDEAEWGSEEDSLNYTSLLSILNTVNKAKANNSKDALIGATALAHGMVLVTDDGDLAAAVGARGGTVMAFAEFLAE
jgi:predicted nucleic acid-binding protein